MIRVQFKEKKEVSDREFPFYEGTVNGVSEMVCIDICSDPMNEFRFLLRVGKEMVMEVDYKLIKHISSC